MDKIKIIKLILNNQVLYKAKPNKNNSSLLLLNLNLLNLL